MPGIDISQTQRLVAYYDGLIDGISDLIAPEAGDAEAARGQFFFGFLAQFCETGQSFSSSQFEALVGPHFAATADICDEALF